METKALVVRNWEDLVFAYRNRDYGAYKIRQAYSRRLMIGLGISITVMAMLLILIDINKNVSSEKIPIPFIRKGDKNPLPPPILPRRTPPQPVQRTSAVHRENLPPRVVREIVEDPVISEPEIPFSTVEGLEAGSGTPEVDVTGQVDLPVAAPVAPVILVVAEVMPVYEGGYEEMMKFLRSKFRYPASARRIGTEGTVYVSFVVNGDGSVRDVSVLRGISADCDKEAVRVISLLPGWRGGKQNGNPVAVRMVLPVKFSLAK